MVSVVGSCRRTRSTSCRIPSRTAYSCRGVLDRSTSRTDRRRGPVAATCATTCARVRERTQRWCRRDARDDGYVALGRAPYYKRSILLAQPTLSLNVRRRAGIHVNESLIVADEVLATFAQHRRTLLKRTAELLCADDAASGDGSLPEKTQQLSAILVASLEELKVAEEELRERTEALAVLRDQLERRRRGERALFDFAPACLVVTDVHGNILDANREALALLKQDLAQLDRRPIATFIQRDDRRGFRDSLARITVTRGVEDWRLVLLRPTDTPLLVSAAVQMVTGSGDGGQATLCWCVRVVADQNR